MNERFEKVKTHIKDHKELYIGLGVGLGVAGITWFIMRDVNQPIKGANSGVLAQGANSGVLGETVIVKDLTLNNVSYISANRKGPPSWVIRCSETGEVFTSQKKAAKALGIPASRISEHLSGTRDEASGYHFERICMAA